MAENRLEAIFFDALAVTNPAERAELLARECGGDQALRQRAEALLAAHHAPDNPLQMPTDEAPPPSPPLSEGPGAVIGNYRLLEPIGEGGFGVVFMAEQERPVRRKVALKVIKLGMDTAHVVARFEAERQALAMMDHPNIAKVLDAGATVSGRPYFVMELVRGVPINRFCRANNLGVKERLALFVTVCSAVQHAHQKGIIHRDLKPSNVLVVMHDDKPVVKVIDFGVAKATQDRLTERTLFTGFYQLIGTPTYMSPEQAGLSGLDIDTRSDIYSLGVLLYELLTGTTPFDEKELLGSALGEMQRIIREVEPPRPSTRLSTLATAPTGDAPLPTDRRRFAASVRGELDWIVMKCLEKDRSRRYESAGALGLDIASYLAEQPVAAGPPTRGYRVYKFIRRNRAAVVAAAVMFLLLVGGIVGTTIGLVGQARQRAIAQQQRTESQFRLAELLFSNARDAEAATILRDQLAEAKAAGAWVTPENARRLGLLGAVLWDERQPQPQRRDAESEQMLREAIRVRRACKPVDEAALSVALRDLGVFLSHQRRFGDAEMAYREAVLLARRALPPDSIDLGWTICHLAGSPTLQEKSPGEAERLYTEALAIYLKGVGPDEWHTLAARYELGMVRTRERRFAEAETDILFSEARARMSPQLYPSVLHALIDLYSDWDRAEPGKGYDAKARQWQERLDSIRYTPAAPAH